MQKSLPAEQYQALLAEKQGKKQVLLAQLQGSGAVAQDHSTAVGERGIKFEIFQTGIALFIKAGFPVVEQPSAHSRFATGPGDASCSFPGLKEKLALLRSCETIVGAFWTHVAMLPHFGVC